MLHYLVKWKLLFLGISIITFISISGYFQLSDFSVYWKATTQFVKGENPYDIPHQLTYVTGVFGDMETIPHLRAWNPPTTFFLLSPFALIPLEKAKAVFLILSFLLIVCTSNEGVRRFISLSDKPNVTIQSLLAITSTVCFLHMLSCGGTAIFLLLWVLTLLNLKSPSETRIGLLVPVLLIKPHLVLLVMPYILASTLFCRRYKIAGNAFLSSIVLFILTFLMNPNSFRDFAQLDVNLRNYAALFCPTLKSTIEHIFDVRVPLTVAAGIPITLGIMLGYVDRNKGLSWKVSMTLLALPLSIFMSPYGWLHDFVLAIPSFWAAIYCTEISPKSRRWIYTLVGLSVFAIFASVTFKGNFQEGWGLPVRNYLSPFIVTPIFAAISLVAIVGFRVNKQIGVEP